MNHFHKILYEHHGKNKSNLVHICSKNFPFKYRLLSFGFTIVNRRVPEELVMNIKIPSPFEKMAREYSKILETYFLYRLSPAIRELYTSYVNVNKDIFSKAKFSCQDTDRRILKRSAVQYDSENNLFILHVNFDMPLLNGVAINQKPSEKAVRDILSLICDVSGSITQKDIDTCIKTYCIQKQIRKYLLENHYCAFVANGSILPRDRDTEEPMKNSIPFRSPESFEITIPVDALTSVTGMGVPCGVTVITGGGYSGKSTLLNALQEGIYDRLPGDGREYVITVNNALQTFSEDGRPVSGVDLSPFFKYLIGGNVTNFSTDHASGSVSQAANIIEAICGGCKLLLVDEDKSATNLMMRDEVMRHVVKQEPIIPFTDRVNEFYEKHDVSTIIVIGGCSEYLFRANYVIMMENFIAQDITTDISDYGLRYGIREILPTKMQDSRRVMPRKTDQAFLYFRNIMTEDKRKIILDDYSADITMLPIIKNTSQMNTLLSILMWLLCDKNANSDELIRKLEELLCKLFSDDENRLPYLNLTDRRYYEELRPIDAYCCVNRVRGLLFARNEE